MSSRGAIDVKRMNTHGNEAGASLLEVMAVAMIISLGALLAGVVLLAVVLAALSALGVVAIGTAVERVADILIPGRKTGLGAGFGFTDSQLTGPTPAMVVRCMMRRSRAGMFVARCSTQRLSHMTRSCRRHRWRYT